MIHLELDEKRRRELPASPTAWLDTLPGSVHLSIPGRDRTRSRAWVTLLHGNEPSGTRGLHAWLLSGSTPAVDLHAFVVSIEAARRDGPFGHRMLPGEPDLNRCFGNPTKNALALALLRELRSLRPEAVVDIHNTSGPSPAYGITTRTESQNFALTARFSERLILTDIRLDSLMEAIEDEFPIVTIECGGANDPAAHQVALAGLEAFASEPHILEIGSRTSPQLLKHPVRVEIQEDASLAFGEHARPDTDLTLKSDMARHNFDPVAPGEVLGWLGNRGLAVLRAQSTDERDLVHDLFKAHSDCLTVAVPLDLLMVTTDEDAAKSDCLFYAVPPGD